MNLTIRSSAAEWDLKAVGALMEVDLLTLDRTLPNDAALASHLTEAVKRRHCIKAGAGAVEMITSMVERYAGLSPSTLDAAQRASALPDILADISIWANANDYATMIGSDEYQDFETDIKSAVLQLTTFAARMEVFIPTSTAPPTTMNTARDNI